MQYLIYSSVMILALGLVTSTTLLALFHIFMIVPAIAYLPKGNYKNFPNSSWALLALVVVIILSVLFNQDIVVNGLKPILKVKYFLFGFISIVPLSLYFNKFSTDKKISQLLYAFCIATTFATIVGIFSRFYQFNPVTWKVVAQDRNAGLFGMVMNYAHNVAYFQIIVTGMVVYRKNIEKFINLNFLYFVFFANLAGLYLTYTRGAWLAYLTAIPFFLFKNNKKKFSMMLILLLVIGIGAYEVAGKKVIRPKSDNQRISQWKAAIMAFKERPVLGYGYLNFEHHSGEIKKRYNIEEADFSGHAHNNLFEMLGSAGILGFLSFMLWLIFWFIEMSKRSDTVGKIGVVFIVVFFVSGLTQSTISLGINLFFIMGAYSISQISSSTIQLHE